jgi:hypothetical protein
MRNLSGSAVKVSSLYGFTQLAFRARPIFENSGTRKPENCRGFSRATKRIRLPLDLSRFNQLHDVRDFPNGRAHTSSHGGRDFERLMDAHKIVEHHVQADRRNVMVQILRERVREGRKAAHVHPHRQVLALNLAGADVPFIRLARDRVFLRAIADGGAVPRFSFARRTVNLDQLCVIEDPLPL